MRKLYIIQREASELSEDTKIYRQQDQTHEQDQAAQELDFAAIASGQRAQD